MQRQAPYGHVIETPDILLQPVGGSGAPVGGASMAYSRAHSLPTTSPALNHQHSMDAVHASTPATAAATAAAAAAAAAADAHRPPPAIESFMRSSYPSQFRQSLSSVDLTDYASNKHQLPLARIKKIMKSDEDVRMISAEAPVLFAKACEMFILDLSLRAWAYVENGPSGTPGNGPKRRTLQRNDVAAAIQHSELFDFLYQIVPITAHNPDEEGTPPHSQAHMEDEPRYTPQQQTRRHATPDVLLERPLQDPYADALPPVHSHSTRAHMPRAASSSNYNRGVSASAPGMSASNPVVLMEDTSSMSLMSPSGVGGGVVGDYGMTSMSRGTSLDPSGGPAISTPVFGGVTMPLELMPDTPNQGGVMTPAAPPTPGANAYYQQHMGMMQTVPVTPHTHHLMHASSIPMPQQVRMQSHGNIPYTPGTHAWLDGTPQSPQPTSTPSTVDGTPSFHSGYSAEGDQEDQDD